jgi:cell division protein FtsB
MVILVVSAAALLVLIGTATGDRGYFEGRRRRAAYAVLAADVEKMRAENATLAAGVAALKTDPYVIEKLAREKLGYARPGEVIYLFPPVEDAPHGTHTPQDTPK